MGADDRAAGERPGSALGRWPFVGRALQLEAVEAAYRDPNVAGVVVLGAPGVGKSRFADEARQALERAGAAARRVFATRTASGLPLGALAHLLPVDVPLADRRQPGPFEVVDAVRNALVGIADPDGHRPVRSVRPLLVIDDAHLLDPLSLVVVGQLLTNGAAFVLATARSTEELPDGLTSFWESGRANRIELGPHSRNQVDALVHIALGGVVEGATTLTLWTYSDGNVLTLHELVLDALARGVLVEGSGVWRLVGPPIGPHHAGGVVGARLAALDETARAVLELLALAEELGLADLEARFPIEVLDQLEQQGLLAIATEGRRLTARIGHPAYADAVRAALSTLRARQVRRSVIEILEGHGARRRGDQVRVVALRVDNREPSDPAALVRAAVLARLAQDHTTVERLARLAYELEPGPVSGRLLGEALFELARFDESLAALDDASALAETVDERFDLAFARTHTLFLGLGRGAEALASLDDLARDPSMAARRTDIELRRAGLAVWVGRIVDARDALTGDWSTTDEGVALELEHARQTVDLMQGRVTEAFHAAEASYRRHLELQAARDPALAWIPPVMHRLQAVWAMIELARFDEARIQLDELYAACIAPGMAGPRRWFTIELGRLESSVGRLATAERWYREAAEPGAGPAQPRAERLALAGVAMTAGQRGDVVGATDAIARLEAVRGDHVELADTEWDRGRAWAEAVQGRVSSAVKILLAAADRARSTGRLLFEHRLLHTVLRLGDAREVAPRLGELAALVDIPVAALAARHAGAMDGGDVDGLDEIAECYRGLGYVLLAAETAGQASDIARRKGDARRATGLAKRSVDLAAACEGAATPALARPETVSPLSAREREVALLVARGATNREIGEELYLSVRTVENHVRGVLMKLGVPSRGEVGAALRAGAATGRGIE
jgi:DNA-binding CsgD family transcriptional regulator/tetratricopeptide (TPR) repeat protein